MKNNILSADRYITIFLQLISLKEKLGIELSAKDIEALKKIAGENENDRT